MDTESATAPLTSGTEKSQRQPLSRTLLHQDQIHVLLRSILRSTSADTQPLPSTSHTSSQITPVVSRPSSLLCRPAGYTHLIFLNLAIVLQYRYTPHGDRSTGPSIHSHNSTLAGLIKCNEPYLATITDQHTTPACPSFHLRQVASTHAGAAIQAINQLTQWELVPCPTARFLHQWVPQVSCRG